MKYAYDRLATMHFERPIVGILLILSLTSHTLELFHKQGKVLVALYAVHSIIHNDKSDTFYGKIISIYMPTFR